MNSKMRYVVLALVTCVLLTLAGGLGCAKEKPPEAPIRYNICSGAQLTKVSLYMGANDLCWMDITVKNTSAQDSQFLVSVQVDDDPAVIAGVEADTKVKGGKEQTYKVMTTLPNMQPKKILIDVAPPSAG